MIRIGTSGYNYPEWRGSFYPPGFPTSKMLPYYAERLSTVEINYTFYRIPSEKVLADWSGATPEDFIFTLKVSRRITHDARLRQCEALLETFWERAQTLGPKLGVLLFQLPPSLKKDTALLEEFLAVMPPGARAAFEFRDTSWHSDDVFAQLKARNLALCIADSEKMTTPVVSTADYGYFRLRDEGYEDSDIERWAGIITQHAGDWGDVFVYFKHEESGKGPEFARVLEEKLDPQP